MNKKSLVLQDFLFFITTFLIFIISISLVLTYSRKESDDNLVHYSEIVLALYDEENNNYSEVDKAFNESIDIRVTILNGSNGDVIYDNNPNYNQEENRLNEFLNYADKGIYEKYSLTLNDKMFYLVRSDGSNYIRVGILKSEVMEVTNNIALYGSISLILLNIIYFILSYLYFKKNIDTLKEEVIKLDSLVNPQSFINDFDIQDLKNTMSKSYTLINEQINEVKSEKEKYEFILNNISEGFIVLDLNYNIIQINKYALNIFNKNFNEVYGHNIVYLYNASNLLNNIEKMDKAFKSFKEKIDERIYEFEINKITFNNINLIAILFIDITNEENTEIMKKEFFANASHELKSPLTSIIGYQELIREGIIKDNNEIKNISEKTLKESIRMKNIVLDMLELSKLESKEVKEIESLNLKEIIEDIISSNEVLIKQKNIKITANLKDFYINSSFEDIQKLLSNIISNAINYNNINGEIELILKDNSFICKDTGIGIKKEDLPRIFERFYRVDKSRSKENSGTGLGLAIVKHICLNYHYKIKVDSKFGLGTTFTIIFK